MASGGDTQMMFTLDANIDKLVQKFNKAKDLIKSTAQTAKGDLASGLTGASAKVTAAGNRITQTGKSIKKHLGMESALAFTYAGDKAMGFARQCVDSAIASESAWTRFNAIAAQNTSGWTDESLNNVKKWASTFSSNMGYATSDTREAATTLLQYGMSMSEVQEGMSGVAALAARTGSSEAEAADMVTKALGGRFNALSRVTGLQKEEFTNADGTIDKMKLLKALYEQNSGALDAHGKTTEAQINKMNNAWGKFKTGVGNALMPVVEIIAKVVTAIAEGFAGLDKNSQTIVAVFLVIGAAVSVVIGALGMLAPILINVGSIISSIGKAGGIFSYLSQGVVNAAKSFKGLFGDVSKVKNALGKLNITDKIKGVPAKVSQSWKSLKGSVDKVRDAIKKADISGKVKGLKSSVASGWKTLKSAVSGAVDSIKKADIMGKISGIKGSVISSWKSLKGAVSGAVTAIKNSTIATKLSAAGSAIAAGAETAYAGAKAALGTITTTVTGAVASFNATLLANPILIVVIAIIALVAILAYLYKNNEQVRNSLNAVFNFIKGSLMGAWQALQPVIQAVADTLKNAWNAAVAAFQRASNTITMIINVIKGAFSKIASGDILGGLSDLGKFLGPLLQSLFPMPNLIAGVFQKIAPAVMPVLQGLWDNIVNAFMGIGDAIGSAFSTVGQTIWNALSMIPNILANLFVVVVVRIRMELFRLVMIAGMIINQLRQAIVTRFNMILARARMIWSQLTWAIRSALTKAVNIATQLANKIRTAIQQKFQQIVNKARSIFQNIVSAIRSKLASAASTARDKAVEIYNNIKNKISEIPQQVADEFGKIPGKIRDALANAASVALSGAQSIVSNFLSGLGRASPGKIQRETVAEFKETAERLTEDLPTAKANASKVARSIVESWSSEMPSEMKLADVGFTNPFDPLNAITASYDANIVGNGMPVMSAGGPPPMANNNMTDNRSVVNNNYHVDRIELDCNNLSTRESRQILYKALDGLYNGGA